MSSIKLHSTLGVNPHVLLCSVCGKDYGLVLLGSSNKVATCNDCGKMIIGHAGNEKCPNCDSYHPSFRDVREIGEFEKFVSGVCTECEKNLLEQREVVRKGGGYFKCKECNMAGAIKDNEFSKMVRKSAGIYAPNPVGIEFNHCSEHPDFNGKENDAPTKPKKKRQSQKNGPRPKRKKDNNRAN